MIAAMMMRGASAVLFAVVVALVVAGPASATLQDGLPRPPGYPVVPSASYGPTPQVLYNGAEIECEWYGFSHNLYPVEGAQCNAGMRRALTNATIAPPALLKPYIYYYSLYYVFDTSTNETYCLYGCFNLGTSSTAPPPSSLGSAPPPVSLTAPPPETLSAPPPPRSSPPPPEPDSSPPPLASPPPPVARGSPPPPATLFTPPPPSSGAITPPTPADGTRIINLNAAPGFLQPAGLVSVLLSGALFLLAAF